MQLRFQKMHGTGNRILIVDQRVDDPVSPDSSVLNALSAAMQDEPFDQLMWLNNPQNPNSKARYRVFNNDGSEVEQCGNGVRCVAVLLATQDPQLQAFSLESPAGIIEARILGPTTVAVNMGTPSFDDSIRRIGVGAIQLEVNIVSMGNPHCVLDVADVSTADVDGIGAAIEQHELFPGRINVGFRHVVDRKNIDLRVFERGVGETRACGTGACAAVAAGIRRGLLDAEVNVRLPGGQVMVSWRGDKASLWLSGDVTFISEGTVDL